MKAMDKKKDMPVAVRLAGIQRMKNRQRQRLAVYRARQEAGEDMQQFIDFCLATIKTLNSDIKVLLPYVEA